MDRIDVERELDGLVGKLKASEYYQGMEKITGPELVDLAVLVDVLVTQLYTMLKKYPEFNHSITLHEENDGQNVDRVKTKSNKNILLTNTKEIRTFRGKLKT